MKSQKFMSVAVKHQVGILSAVSLSCATNAASAKMLFFYMLMCDSSEFVTFAVVEITLLKL